MAADGRTARHACVAIGLAAHWMALIRRGTQHVRLPLHAVSRYDLLGLRNLSNHVNKDRT
jgi:hypothetical protein